MRSIKAPKNGNLKNQRPSKNYLTSKWGDHQRNRAFIEEAMLRSSTSASLPDALYTISKSHFRQHKGKVIKYSCLSLCSRLYPTALAMLTRYSNSPSKTIMTLFPEYDWKPWKFKGGPPKEWWKDKTNQRAYLLHLLESRRKTNTSQTNNVDLNEIYSLTHAILVANNGMNFPCFSRKKKKPKTYNPSGLG